MKPHPRIRKAVKWGGAAVTVLLVVVWIGSGWWEVRCDSRKYRASLSGGTVYASNWEFPGVVGVPTAVTPVAAFNGINAGREIWVTPHSAYMVTPALGAVHPDRFEWTLERRAYGSRFRWGFDGALDRATRAGFATIPLWAPTLLALLTTATAWRCDAVARRRARVGLCPTCHYDRAGLAAGADCPECGAAA